MFSDNDDDAAMHNIVLIHTIENGHNSGRTTILLAESEKQRDEWVKFLNTSKEEALHRKNRPDDLGFPGNLQRTCRQIYSSNLTQYSIGVVIMCSYMAGISLLFVHLMIGNMYMFDCTALVRRTVARRSASSLHSTYLCCYMDPNIN